MPLLSKDVKQNRLIVTLCLIECYLQVANVVPVDGTDVMKSEFFKQRAADKSFFNSVFQIVKTAMKRLSDNRQFCYSSFDFVLNALVNGVGAKSVEITSQTANARAD